MPKSRRLRMDDVEPGLEQHDKETDAYAAYFAEMDEIKVEARKLRKQLRKARLEIREARACASKWRRRCLALAGRFRLPRGRGVIRLKSDSHTDANTVCAMRCVLL